MDHRRHPYRWMMLFGLWLAYAGFGLVLGAIPPLLTTVRADLGLSKASMGSILGAWALVYLVVAMPAGAVVDRLGVRRALAAGAALVALSGALRALATGYWSMFGAVAVFGLGGPLISVGAPKLIATWFDEFDRPTAMGLYITGPAVGTVVSLATANSVVMPSVDNDWRAALLVYAALAALTNVAWIVISGRAPAVDAAHAGGHQVGISAFADLARLPIVQVMLVLGLGGFLFNHALNGWLPDILREGGYSSSASGYLASITAGCGIVGSIVASRMGDERTRPVVLGALFAVLGVCAALLTSVSGPVLLVVLAMLGAAKAATVPVALLILMDAPGVNEQNMGAAGGLFFTAGEVGGVSGPLLFGAIADAAGDYDPGLLALTGLASVLLAVCVGLSVWRRRAIPALDPTSLASP